MTAFTPLAWPDLTSRPRPIPDATIAYGDDSLQVVDLWLPDGPAPHAVVLMVHGGCWQTSIADRRLMDWAAADLREAGLAVWNIDYRGVDRAGGGYPGTFRDVAAAADRLRSDAGRYRLDSTRLVALGHSAGGHLALWLAARHRIVPDSPLHAADPLAIPHVVSLGGLPDLEAVAASPDNGCGTDVVAQLVGGSLTDTSIPHLLPLGISQTLVNGDADAIVPHRFATDYVAMARAKGDPATLYTVPYTGHVELIAPGTPAWDRAKIIVLALLN